MNRVEYTLLSAVGNGTEGARPASYELTSCQRAESARLCSLRESPHLRRWWLRRPCYLKPVAFPVQTRDGTVILPSAPDTPVHCSVYRPSEKLFRFFMAAVVHLLWHFASCVPKFMTQVRAQPKAFSDFNNLSPFDGFLMQFTHNFADDSKGRFLSKQSSAQYLCNRFPPFPSLLPLMSIISKSHFTVILCQFFCLTVSTFANNLLLGGLPPLACFTIFPSLKPFVYSVLITAQQQQQLCTHC